MKKFIVLGLVAIMALGLSAVAHAAYTADTDWLVYLKAADQLNGNSTTFNAGSQTTALDVIDAKDSVIGSAPPSTSVIIAGYDLGGNYGYSADRRAALEANSTKTWSDIRLSLGSGATTVTSVRLLGWNASGTYDMANYLGQTLPNRGGVRVIVVHDVTGTYEDGTVLWDFQGLTNGASATPQFTATFNNVAALKTGYTQLKIYAYVPEPGSMAALGSGLVGLIGFAIRRRK